MGRIDEVFSPFLHQYGLTLTQEQSKEVLSKAGMLSVRTLLEGGLIRDERVLDYEDFESYAQAVKSGRKEARQAVQTKWIGQSIARKIWVEAPAKKAAIRQSLEIKEAAIAVVEEYYKVFTEASVRQAMIQIHERNYGGDKRIGIMVKAEPYASQFTLQVRGIIGPHNVANEGKGWNLQMEPGSAVFSIKKRYTRLPSQEQLIDDLCVWDWLETLPAKGVVKTDTHTYPIYPTAKDVFETGYSVQQPGEAPYKIHPVDEVSGQMGFNAFLVMAIGMGHKAKSLTYSPVESES